MFRLLALFAAFALLSRVGGAQDKAKDAKKAPRTMLAIPLGVTPGTETKVILRGLNLDGATGVKLVEGMGSVTFESVAKAGVPDKNPERVGDVQVAFRLKLDAKATSAKVVVVTPQGETAPHALRVEWPAPTPEKEPNDGFRAGHLVSAFPATLAGVIDRPRDVDVFRFAGKKGQRLTAEVFADRHGSPLDAQLVLYRTGAIQVASSDDAVGRDPKLETTLPADDEYYLSLTDAHDLGGALHVYRLRLEATP